jgi:UDP-N-acetylmuramyl pentapeptide phosphotransferase/UDP-N-acetylglucosamine-1-phosphate transferase
MLTFTTIFFSVFGIAWWTCVWLAGPYSLLRILDIPNERSLHTRPTARTGGVGVLLAIIVGAVSLKAIGVTPPHGWAVFGLGYAAIAAISICDDYHHVPIVLRFSIHLLVSTIPCWLGLTPTTLNLPGIVIPLPPAIGTLATILFCAWMINLYNFMDGMDGFAGGMSLFGFGTLSALSWLAGQTSVAAYAALFAVAALGFLVVNFPPARLFLGDIGSAPLGYAVAYFSLLTNQNGIAPVWVSVLIFSPFVIDASATLLRRLRNGERVWQPHRSHYYQRLVTAGWSHRRTVLWEYGVMLICALCAIGYILSTVPPFFGWLLIAGCSIGYWALSRFVRKIERSQVAIG